MVLLYLRDIMNFSPSFLERLRSHFLMSEVVGRRMPIKKAGRTFQGICPFHGEKTPSFTVSDERGSYHCFGCGAHGDVISFVKNFDKISFPAAVESLAREAGMEIAKPSPAEYRKIEAEKTLYEVVEEAAKWFEKQFFASGMIAKNYARTRGIRPDTIQKFRIGYAPDERAALHNNLLNLGFSKELQAESGLIITTETGAIYDKFRDRLMFPIRNSSGKVIAFGGRLLTNNAVNKNLPKYLNSPETPLFKKSEVLYNLDLAKTPARDGNMVVVMEGYMDVVMTAQAGVNYGVATLGTAVSAEHLRQLWQLAKEPVLCLDGDAAGKRAMLRAAEIALPLLKPSYSLRFAILPKGDDPDSYIQKHGKASFEKILHSARLLSQVLWEETLAPNYNLDLPEGKAAIDDAYQKLTAKITDNTVRGHYLSYFRKILWEHGKSAKIKKPSKLKTVANQAKTTSPQVEQRISQHHSADLEKLAEKLLELLANAPSLLHKSDIEEAVLRLHIRSSHLQISREKLLEEASHATENDEENETQALSLWNETFAAYEVADLELEYGEMTKNMQAFTDEADFARFLELQNNLNLARARRTFATARDDMA